MCCSEDPPCLSLRQSSMQIQIDQLQLLIQILIQEKFVEMSQTPSS